MSDYARAHDFSAKDSLSSGDAAKAIKGSEHDAEFDAIVTAIASKLDKSGGVLTGSLEVNDTVIFHQGGDLTSASALGVNAAGNLFDVTGTTGITSLAAKGVGSIVVLQFDAAVAITHHASNLILPGGSSITTAAGDILTFYEYAAGDWRMIAKNTTDVSNLSSSATVTSEGGAATTNIVQGVLKFWANLSGAGTPALDDSFNCASVTDNGSGDRSIVIANDMHSSANYASLAAMPADGNTNGNRGAGGYQISAQAAGSCRYVCMSGSTGSGDGLVSDAFTTEGIGGAGDLS